MAGFLAFQAEKSPLLEIPRLASESFCSQGEITAALKADKQYRELSPGVYCSGAQWRAVEAAAVKALKDFSAKSQGLMGEGDLLRAVGTSIGLPQKPVRAILSGLAAAGVVRKEAKGYKAAGAAAPVADAAERARQEKIRAVLKVGEKQPVSLRELISASKEIKNSAYALVKAGEVLALADDHFMFKQDYEAARERVIGYLREKGQGATSDLRVFLNMSRKNVVYVLEQMDRDRVTYLKDNVRRLMKG
jgi:hypothetical protein